MVKKFTYRCGQCGKEVKLSRVDKIRCVYCGYRILFKIRERVARRVKAR